MHSVSSASGEGDSLTAKELRDFDSQFLLAAAIRPYKTKVAPFKMRRWRLRPELKLLVAGAAAIVLGDLLWIGWLITRLTRV